MNAITPTDPKPATEDAGKSGVPDLLISYEPATGEEFWRGRVSDIDTAVKTARRAFPAWAAQPLATRMELIRRFANEVRKDFEKLADTIARETGKPLWEANAEVENVINKVELSIRAFADRTAQRKLDSAIQGMMAVRHKPHGVMAVLGPYNMPAHLPNAHIVPALIAGNTVISQTWAARRRLRAANCCTRVCKLLQPRRHFRSRIRASAQIARARSRTELVRHEAA
ncbi:MAG: aldehyde dehydrogenase family protein [Hyphomonas sp.]